MEETLVDYALGRATSVPPALRGYATLLTLCATRKSLRTQSTLPTPNGDDTHALEGKDVGRIARETCVPPQPFEHTSSTFGRSLVLPEAKTYRNVRENLASLSPAPSWARKAPRECYSTARGDSSQRRIAVKRRWTDCASDVPQQLASWSSKRVDEAVRRLTGWRFNGSWRLKSAPSHGPFDRRF